MTKKVSSVNNSFHLRSKRLKSRTDRCSLTLSAKSDGGEGVVGCGSERVSNLIDLDDGPSLSNVTFDVYLYYARALGATQLSTAFMFYIAYQVSVRNTS